MVGNSGYFPHVKSIQSHWHLDGVDAPGRCVKAKKGNKTKNKLRDQNPLIWGQLQLHLDIYIYVYICMCLSYTYMYIYVYTHSI